MNFSPLESCDPILLVLGKACTFSSYLVQQSAAGLEESSLVDWHGVTIDRYDVRGLLSAPPPPYAGDGEEIEEGVTLAEVNAERYHFLQPGAAVLSSWEEEEQLLLAEKEAEVAHFLSLWREALDEVGAPAALPWPSSTAAVQLLLHTVRNIREKGAAFEIFLRTQCEDKEKFSFLREDGIFHEAFLFLRALPEEVFWKLYLRRNHRAVTALDMLSGYDDEKDGQVDGEVELLLEEDIAVTSSAGQQQEDADDNVSAETGGTRGGEDDANKQRVEDQEVEEKKVRQRRLQAAQRLKGYFLCKSSAEDDVMEGDKRTEREKKRKLSSEQILEVLRGEEGSLSKKITCALRLLTGLDSIKSTTTQSNTKHGKS